MLNINSSPQCSPKRNEDICPQSKFYKNVQSNFTHNNQKLKTWYLSTGTWINQLWYIYTIKYNWATTAIKEWITSDVCKNMDKFQGQCFEGGGGPDTKSPYYMISFMWISRIGKQAKLICGDKAEQILTFWSKGKRSTWNRHKEIS